MPKDISYIKPTGGLSVWLNLPERLLADDVIENAKKQGVIISNGAPFFVRRAPHRQLRISFAVLSLAEIKTGNKDFGRDNEIGGVLMKIGIAGNGKIVREMIGAAKNCCRHINCKLFVLERKARQKQKKLRKNVILARFIQIIKKCYRIAISILSM